MARQEYQSKGYTGFIREEAGLGQAVIKTWLDTHTAKWVFQQERGAEGGLHYQLTFEMKTKCRKHQVLDKFSDDINVKKHIWIAPIAKDGHKAAWEYASKTDTRVNGPWTMEEKKEELPLDLKCIEKKAIPFQTKCIEYMKEPWSEAKSREAWVIIDPSGGKGKTTVVKYLKWLKLAGNIHPAEAKAMGRQAYKDYIKYKFKGWTFNLGMSGLNEKMMNEFWRGIEQIKDGDYHDDRYDSGSVLVTTPKIIVFCNDMVDTSKLAADRWKLWLIYNDDLVPYTPHRFMKLQPPPKEEKKEEKVDYIPGLDDDIEYVYLEPKKEESSKKRSLHILDDDVQIKKNKSK